MPNPIQTPRINPIHTPQINRILPPHELNARRARKRVLPPCPSPSAQPRNPTLTTPQTHPKTSPKRSALLNPTFSYICL